ncbi:HDOD domain-containing protein [Myxococcota bacterium]|nr:HDOD domain-containing protein [Myxococcota bacterium]
MANAGQGKTRGQAGYGEGRAAIRDGDDCLLDEEAMAAELLACLEAPDYRPPTLPVVAVELMALSARADVGIPEVVALIERDSLIAGRVLHVAGSAALAGGAKITSLREATMRLGLLRIRDLVMQITLNLRVFKSETYGEAMERVRRHAVATAHLCRTVCKYTPIDGEFAFMAGLLHDVGIAGTLLALADRKGRRGKAPDLLSIWPAVDRVHVRAGEIMAQHWQLPADLRLAITGHHQVLFGGHAHPLAATLALANELAHAAGAGLVAKPDGDEPAVATEAGSKKRAPSLDWTSAFSELDRTGSKTLESARQALGIDARIQALIEGEASQVVDSIAVEG